METAILVLLCINIVCTVWLYAELVEYKQLMSENVRLIYNALLKLYKIYFKRKKEDE